jgi:hypothetical protein
MGIVFVAAVWRVVVVGGEARRTAQSMRVASDVAHRADGLICELATSLDGLRHRRLEPAQVTETILAGRAGLAALAGEARTAMEKTANPAIASLVGEIDRAARSLDLIEHGCDLMAETNGLPGEGETAVKRGYLNLLHTRDAIRDRGDEIRAASAPASVVRAADRR